MSGNKRETVIVSAVRTPFGKFGGVFKDFTAVELGALAIKGAMKEFQDQVEVDYVLMGMVLQGGAGQIPSRQASIKAGLPQEVPSDTINKVCISSLRTISMADQMIRSGDADVVVAGGMESMSNASYGVPSLRWGKRMGAETVIDLMVHDGLTCAFHNVHMALHGSKVAKEYGISRQEQDEWALRSHQLASHALKSGRLEAEIVAVVINQPKGQKIIVNQDEAPRADTSLAKLVSLQPLFDPEGTVTAGNAPGVNDGAAALLLMSREKADKLGIKPLATVLGSAMVAAEPAYIATVPGLATKKLVGKLGMTVNSLDLIEANEAFAAVALTSEKIAGWDANKVNVNGGAIAFGHPIGASGGRIVTTLIHELVRRGGGIGLAAICGGGAQGDALAVRVD
jgi:acetyl-CoA C-acetyltransferase